MARAHKSVGAGKYSSSSEKKSSSDNKKQMQSFKAEIVKSLVKSLNKKGSSSKKRCMVSMDEFDMEQFCDLKVSDDESHSSESSKDSNDSWKIGQAAESLVECFH